VDASTLSADCRLWRVHAVAGPVGRRHRPGALVLAAHRQGVGRWWLGMATLVNTCGGWAVTFAANVCSFAACDRVRPWAAIRRCPSQLPTLSPATC